MFLEVPLMSHREYIESFKPTQAPPHPPTLARRPLIILPYSPHTWVSPMLPPRAGPSTCLPAHPQTSYTRQAGQQWRQNSFGLTASPKTTLPGNRPDSHTSDPKSTPGTGSIDSKASDRSAVVETARQCALSIGF